jgi:hypothetical protein
MRKTVPYTELKRQRIKSMIENAGWADQDDTPVLLKRWRRVAIGASVMLAVILAYEIAL